MIPSVLNNLKREFIMKVVVCIPVFNEEKNIRTVLDNVILQDKSDFELKIIIISSGSTDKTNHIIQNHPSYGQTIHLLIEPERTGKANAINKVLNELDHEKQDICIFTDGDVLIGNNTLKIIIDRFSKDKNISTLTGHPIPCNQSGGIWAKIAFENCAIWDEVRIHQSKKFQVWTLTGYLFAIRYEDIPKKIPFKLLAEDAFFGIELLFKNKKLIYDTNALVYVKFPTSIFDYYRQKSRTRFGWAQINKFAPRQLRMLKKLQRKVIFSRLYKGNYLSLLCLFLDYLMWILGQITNLRKKNRHIWTQIASTK